MPKRWTGGGAKVRHQPTVTHRKGLARKPAAPAGPMQMVDGKAMIEDRLPRKKR